MTQEACNWPDTSIWVEVDGKGECIRYFHAGLEADAFQEGLDSGERLVHVWFHRDKLNHYWRRPGGQSVQVIGYSNNDPDTLRGFAERELRTYGIPYIRLSRPGAYGSSGDHKQRRRPRELKVVNAALNRLKDKYSIKKFALTGQSGGGHIVGSLLANRDDIKCAVITSGVVAVRMRLRERGWRRDATGYSDYFDPIDHVSEIPRDEQRRIFVVGDPRDSNVPFQTQSAYYEAVKEAGHRAWLIQANGRGEEHHGLSIVGFKITRWCVEGMSSEDILKMAKALRESS